MRFVMGCFLAVLGLVHSAHAGTFLWGVANASFQVEGSPADSDWRRWTHTLGRIGDGTDAERATDFLHRYDEDFAWAQILGLNSFRISLAWERIEPREGIFDPGAIEIYRRMIRAMRARGLEPVVTLQHFTLPGWLADQGGLLSPRLPRLFAEYARYAVSELSDSPAGVKIWLTTNEPMVMILGGYAGGGFPPGHNNILEAERAAGNLAVAHLEAVRAIRALGRTDLQVSLAHHWLAVAPRNPRNWGDRFYSHQADEVFNHQFIDAVMTGVIRFGVAPFIRIQKRVPLPAGKPGLDFLDLNYYRRALIRSQLLPPFFTYVAGPGPQNDLGWETYPQGLADALTTAYGRWHLPILITENGIADATDAQRPQYLASHLEALLQAKVAGVPVLGYVHWSLTDNFEWAQGEKARFGLMEIDYSTGERKPRASFLEYGRLIQRLNPAFSR